MKNQRTQRDHDIIRQSSLKAAVDLTTAMFSPVDSNVDIPEQVLLLAEQFSRWVLDGHADPVQEKVNGIRQELQETPPANPVYDKLHNLREKIARSPAAYKPLSHLETDGWNGQWFQRGQTTFGASPGDPYPVSRKQYGFLFGLHKEVGADPDPQFLLGLSTAGASEMIEYLQALKNNGNGDGKRALANARQQIRERRL